MTLAKRRQAPKPYGAKSFGEVLDAAVKARFPGVDCDTYFCIFAMSMRTRWWVAGTEDTKLKPAQAKLVREFVAGFSAAHDALVQP